MGVGVAVGRGQRLRLAYADPPYPGLSKRYYGEHVDFGGEVDHPELIRSLSVYDGWALSTSARALQSVLASCPPGVRVAAWHRGERPTRSAGPLNAWEPVIYWGGRLDSTSAPKRRADPHDASRSAAASHVVSAGEHDGSSVVPDVEHDASRQAGAARRVDSLVFHSRPRLTDPGRVVGAKSATFCRWVFDLLGAQPQDEFTDMFPGSGGVLRAWDVFTGSEAA